MRCPSHRGRSRHGREICAPPGELRSPTALDVRGRVNSWFLNYNCNNWDDPAAKNFFKLNYKTYMNAKKIDCTRTIMKNASADFSPITIASNAIWRTMHENTEKNLYNMYVAWLPWDHSRRGLPVGVGPTIRSKRALHQLDNRCRSGLWTTMTTWLPKPFNDSQSRQAMTTW